MKIKTVKKIVLLSFSVFLFLALGYSLYSQDLLLNTILVNVLRFTALTYLVILFTSRLFLFKEKTFLTIVEVILLLGFQFLVPINILFQFIYLILFTIFSYNIIDNTKDILFSNSKKKEIDYKSRIKPERKQLIEDKFIETMDSKFEKELKKAQQKFDNAYIIKNYIIEDKTLMKNKGKIVKFNYILLTNKGVYIFELMNDIMGDLYSLEDTKNGKWLEGRPNQKKIKQIINPIKLLKSKEKKLLEKLENTGFVKRHSMIDKSKIYNNVIFNNQVNFYLNRDLKNINLIKEEEFENLVDDILSKENIMKEKEILGLYYELI